MHGEAPGFDAGHAGQGAECHQGGVVAANIVDSYQSKATHPFTTVTLKE